MALTRIKSSGLSDEITTSAIPEGDNLYFSNDRVAANVVAFLPSLSGDNITIAANGRISATATGGGGDTGFNPFMLMGA